MRCPTCQHDNPRDASFCNGCGAPLNVACPACGKLNPPLSLFCNSCGKKLAGGDLNPSSPPSVASPKSYSVNHRTEEILTSKSALEGERKQVTVLFADMKGSLEAIARSDPEEVRKILDPVVEKMKEAVHRYEGTVNRVMGDGIMALFGAPLSQEDHAVRACYAALAMQASVQRYSEEMRSLHGVEAQIRVGVNSGETLVRTIEHDVSREYSAEGVATHLAARMEQLAAPGSIRITAETLRLAEGYVQVKSMGPVAVKGLAEPVEVFELTGVGAARTRLQAAAARGLTKFVGRSAELSQMFASLERAMAGHGEVIALVGEAGVGKSRLVGEFTHSHCAQGLLVLETSSVSYRKTSAWRPVIDLLKVYFQITERDDGRTIRERVAGKLLMLDSQLEALLSPVLYLLDVPTEDASWEHLEPAERRIRILHACKHLLLRVQAQPLLLVFEDLHWIDNETQALLDALVESLPTARVLLLVNYRPEYQHRWGGKSYYTQIRVDPLAPESAEALLDALLGSAAALGPIGQSLLQRTGGNPLFLEESVRSLAETGVLEGTHGAYRWAKSFSEIEVPTTVQAMLAARIDRLSSAHKRLLQTASVIGKDVPYTLLLEIAGLTVEVLRAGLNALQAAEFLYETGAYPELAYTFKHALTHDVAYASLLQERRRALHVQIFEAIERTYADRLSEQVERLAHHALRGAVWDKAVDYLRQSGMKAFNRSAYREAVTHLEQAIDALSHLPQARERIEEAVDLRLAVRPFLVPLGEHARALEISKQAEPLAKALGDVWREVLIQGFISGSLNEFARLDEAIAHGMQAVRLAESVGDPALGIIARFYVAEAYVFRGAHRTALSFSQHDPGLSPEDLINLRRAQSGPSLHYGAPAAYNHVLSLNFSSFCLAELGEFDEAFVYSERAMRMAEAFDIGYLRAQADAYMGHVYLRKGELPRAVLLLERCVRSYPSADARYAELVVAEMLGPAFTLSGHTDEAIALFERGRDFADAKGLIVLKTAVLAHLGDAYSRVGKLSEAADAAGRALGLAREHGLRGYEASALYLLGEIHSRATPLDADRSREAYEQGRSLAHELEMRPLEAMCALGAGTLGMQTGERDAAQADLTAAVVAFRQMGMQFWLEKAETVGR